MQNIFRSIPEVFKDLEGNEAANEAAVFAAWRKISGESLGDHAVPLRLIKKKLLIAVASETWRKQIHDLSAQMIFKLNSVLGTSLVTFVEFRIDAAAVERERSKTANPQMSEAELKAIALKHVTPDLRHAAETIADKKLRYNFLLAAGSSLARTKLDKKLR